MNAFLGLLAACAGIAAVGWVISRITGAKAWFLEDWAFLPGETVRWRDDRTDFVLITQVGSSLWKQPVRTRRCAVVGTDRRVILANRTFTGKRMVQYVLWFGAAPDGMEGKLGGGQLTRGYATLVVAPGERVEDYVVFRPLRSSASALNVAEIRVYTDEWVDD